VFFTESSTSLKRRIKSIEAFQTRKHSYFISSMNVRNINYDDVAQVAAVDQTIKEEYDMINIAFEACQYNSISSDYYAKIPRYTFDDKELRGEFKFDAPPKFLLFGKSGGIQQYNIEIRDNKNNILGKRLLRCVAPEVGGNSVKAQSLVNKYYPVLKHNILADMRFIEDVEFLLTPQDIEEFDPFTPVYIDYFGAYFYVNNIKNYLYMGIEKPKVDLIKISSNI